MTRLEYLNSVFTERLSAVAGEIFQVVKDIIAEYQEETDRTKQENVYLKTMLTAKTSVPASGPTGRGVPQELPSISRGPLDSHPAVIQVKVELSTMNRDTEPQKAIRDPSSRTSPAAAIAPHHFSGKTIHEERKDDCLRHNPEVAIKSEPRDSQVICDNSTALVQSESITEHHLGGLRDGHGPDPSLQCQISYEVLQSETAERVMYCEYCGKPFGNRNQLKKHTLVHQKDRPRPYRCDLCGKCFAYAQVLEVHRRTHTGERPYDCRFCGRRFNQRGHLKEHERIHTGEKPFSCQICGKRFIQSSQVRKHVNYHHPTVQL